ncbi:MAG TPA: histidine kinase [Pseudomonas sp.]|uniref:AhpA/YtjB family protein n=1 Tax=Stutzerimonas xanthomarina TaxID=271420 RepID=UPI000E880BD0|nr:AhpA/YtjB family protein [Stutzerimonas xanthomarina]MBU0851265.1 histidine kinase [Gammaproteobacteria bacterium]HAQ85164.1 histidine kinase [Pseudomonas sp.]MBK3849111.1 histidine kinase [Stutzerimonas xanthomarina]MBU1303099.1 histidine kinase [Gammaproteobacteria bacterium]MBU1460781.1 histidine kinase [Gammaproteobacteria bacterium]
MNRPASVKPDNFFLLIYRALRQRRVPLVLRVASHTLLLVALALIIYAWVMGMQFKHAMEQQADALGQSLITQTAASATDLLVANDILSLNVLLSNLVKNPLVAHAAIYSVDNRVLAESGARPQRSLLGDEEGLYSTPISFQEVIAGHLRISLDMQQFQQPMTISLQSMGLLSLILLALTLTLSMRLGRQLSLPLMQLRLWLRDPDDPAPGAGRQDEIGELARQLQARLVPEKPEPEIELDDSMEDLYSAHFEVPVAVPVNDYERSDTDLRSHLDDVAESLPTEDQATDDSFENDFDDDPPFDEPKSQPAPAPAVVTPAAPATTGKSGVLAIQLGAQEQLRRLPRARLTELLQRYSDCLQQASTLYQAELHTLNDGSSLMLFHSQDDEQNYLTHALCCGELMRALGHALQIEVADSGITLQLQLGLTQGEGLYDLSQGDLLLSEPAQAALAMSQHSRNLLLVERGIGEDNLIRQRARIRPIASPEGACCVERLLEPYPSLLERQLARMHELRNRIS